MPFDDQQIDQLRAIVGAALAAPRVTDRIFTRWEAAVYTKHVPAAAPENSADLTAFYRWCSRNGVTSVTAGRYSRMHLDRGIEHEARRTRLARIHRRRARQAAPASIATSEPVSA